MCRQGKHSRFGRRCRRMSVVGFLYIICKQQVSEGQLVIYGQLTPNRRLALLYGASEQARFAFCTAIRKNLRDDTERPCGFAPDGHFVWV